MKNPMASIVGVERESRKINGAYFRRFWIKEPHHSETIPDEKSYFYIVARVSCL